MSPNTHARASVVSGPSAERHPLAFIPRAEALRTGGWLAQALDVCQRGLAASPATVAGRLLLARILVDMGKYAPAEAECEAVLTQARQSVCARRLLVKVFLHRHKFARAVALIEELKAETGDDAELAKALERAQRGLRDGHDSSPPAAEKTAPAADGPPTRAAFLMQLCERPEVEECRVIVAGGDTDKALGEMLEAWAGAGVGLGQGRVHRAILESSKGTLLIQPLESDSATLVVKVRPGAALNPTKRLINQIVRLENGPWQAVPEAVVIDGAQGGQDER
jgi:tetratricopeptide (TPR) repeat protein